MMKLLPSEKTPPDKSQIMMFKQPADFGIRGILTALSLRPLRTGLDSSAMVG